MWFDWLFLYQKKGDLEGAEEHYSLGILEDPRDGQMLYLYAGIVWQIHHDKDRAAAYFERAVEASPMDRYEILIGAFIAAASASTTVVCRFIRNIFTILNKIILYNL